MYHLEPKLSTIFLLQIILWLISYELFANIFVVNYNW